MRRAFLFAIPLCAACVSSVRAQSGTATPEQVVRDFFKAEEDGRWLDAARLLDLHRFEPIRQTSLRTGLPPASRPQMSAEEMMKLDPGMPRAVAEYQIKKVNDAYKRFDLLAHDYARVPSVDSLRALPVGEAAARWLEARGSRWQLELARRESTRAPQMKCPELPDSMKTAMDTELRAPSAVVLGTTEGSDSVRYVVVGRPRVYGKGYRSADPDMEMSPMVVTLTALNGSWRIVPALDMPTSEGYRAGSTSFSIACATVASPGSTPRKK